MLKGKDVRKYESIKHDYYVIYPHFQDQNKTFPYEEIEFQNKFPLTFEYLSSFKDELIKKKIHKKTNPKYWYSLHRSREVSIFEQLKIVTPETSLGGNMTIDSSSYYHNTQVYSLIKNPSVIEDYKYWLAILNSSLFWFFLQSTGAVLRGGYFRFKTKYLEPFPLPKLKNIEEQNPFIEKVDSMIERTSSFQYVQNQFIQLLQSKFTIEKLTKKLENWYELEFRDFLKELKKAKVQMSLAEEAEWMHYFNEQKQKAQAIKAEIEKTDSEIDQMVYELYGLTEEEIEIVES